MPAHSPSPSFAPSSTYTASSIQQQQQQMQQQTVTIPPVVHAVGGSIGSTLSLLLLYPLERARIEMQAQAATVTSSSTKLNSNRHGNTNGNGNTGEVNDNVDTDLDSNSNSNTLTQPLLITSEQNDHDNNNNNNNSNNKGGEYGSGINNVQGERDIQQQQQLYEEIYVQTGAKAIAEPDTIAEDGATVDADADADVDAETDEKESSLSNPYPSPPPSEFSFELLQPKTPTSESEADIDVDADSDDSSHTNSSSSIEKITTKTKTSTNDNVDTTSHPQNRSSGITSISTNQINEGSTSSKKGVSVSLLSSRMNINTKLLSRFTNPNISKGASASGSANVNANTNANKNKNTTFLSPSDKRKIPSSSSATVEKSTPTKNQELSAASEPLIQESLSLQSSSSSISKSTSTPFIPKEQQPNQKQQERGKGDKGGEEELCEQLQNSQHTNTQISNNNNKSNSKSNNNNNNIPKKDGLYVTMKKLHQRNELYKGATPVAITLAISNFIFFYALQLTKKLLRDVKNRAAASGGGIGGSGLNVKGNSNASLLASTIAGILNVLITNPLWMANLRLIQSKDDHFDIDGTDDGNDGDDLTDIVNGNDGSTSKRKNQQRKKMTLWKMLCHIARTEGVKQLWNGTWASLILVSNPAIQYYVYERCKDDIMSIRQRQFLALQEFQLRTSVTTTTKQPRPMIGLSPLDAFVLGAVAKGIATVLTYPLQLAQVLIRLQSTNSDNHNHNRIAKNDKRIIRENSDTSMNRAGEDEDETVMQQQGCSTSEEIGGGKRISNDNRSVQHHDTETGTPYFSGTFNCMTQLYKQGGIRALYAGMDAKLVQTVLTSALTFLTYEQIVSLVTKSYTIFKSTI